MARACIAAVLATLLVAAARSGGQEEKPYASTAQERVKAFRWFGTLGFPGVKGRKFVHVATGQGYQRAGEPPTNRYLHGFLTEDRGDTFSVLSLSLSTVTFKKTPPGTPEHARVGYEALAPARAAAERLKVLREKDSEEGRSWRGFGRAFSERGELFVLAWACWRHGLDGSAAELFDHAGAARSFGFREGAPGRTVQDKVAGDLAHALMWQAILDFGNPKISRAQFLERFEHIARNFPDSEHHKRARETADLLKTMIREDAGYAKKRQAGKPFEKLSKKEQIAELIFRLRDQNGRQWGQPGSCDIFNDKENSPAHQLRKMGLDAVPQLIEALDDERFTRSVGYHRDFYFSHHVLRVADCAERILSDIAARRFYRRTHTNGAMFKDGKGASVKVEIWAWYNEVRKKGEKRMLIEGVEKGDANSTGLGHRLLEKYPDEALPALTAGARAARDGWTRSYLVELASWVKGDGPLPFLSAEVKDGPYRASRVAAAWGLHKHGRGEGVPATIAEWHGHRPKGDKGTDPSEGLGGILTFLARSGTVEGVTALGKDLLKRSVDVRLSVVRSLAEVPLKPGAVKPRADLRELRAAVERVLAACLDDTDMRLGMSGGWGDKHYSDPRICDMAAHVLYRLDAAKYPFDLSAPRAKRERGRLVVKNAWRAANGLPAVPLPVPRRIEPVADARLRPLLDRLLSAPEEGRAKVQRQIERLGLGALPGVLARRKPLRKDEPASALLDGLARRLASTVVEVIVTEKSLAPDAALAARLNGLKGQPLEPQAFIDILTSLVKKLPRWVRAVRWSAERDGDGTGVTLHLDLLDAGRSAQLPGAAKVPAGPKGPPTSWSFSERIEVGGIGVRGLSGSAPEWTGRDDLSAALGDTFGAAPDQPFDARVEVRACW